MNAVAARAVTDRQSDTQSEYLTLAAHARRGLMMLWLLYIRMTHHPTDDNRSAISQRNITGEDWREQSGLRWS